MRRIERDGQRGYITIGSLIKTVLVLGFFTVLAFDGAALMRATAGVTEAAPDAGKAAVEAIAGQHITSATAEAAYEAAEAVAAKTHTTVRRADFALTPDGWVHLTVEAHASTLALHLLPGFSDITTPSKTLDVTP